MESLAEPPEVCGRLVDIGGRRLCARVRGSGSPTVVFESGAGSPSFVWRDVEAAVGSDVTTVAYERAGIGWSEPADRPRTGTAIVEDLDRLLNTLDLAPPYVLVAHSAGALYARLYQATHPEAVAGMVFVDAVDGDTYEQARRQARPHERMLASAQQRVLSPAMAVADRVGLVAAVMRRTRPTRSLAADAALVEARRALWTGRNRMAGSRAEGRHLEDTARTVGQLGTLGDLPIGVVRAGEARGLFKRIARAWDDTQARLTALSTDSSLIVADGAGHFVQLDRPDVVADAIKRITEELSAPRTDTRDPE